MTDDFEPLPLPTELAVLWNYASYVVDRAFDDREDRNR